MRRALLIASIAFSTLLGLMPGHADTRVALVIGNSTYRDRDVSRLANPANDARLMAETLRDLGFSLVGGGAQLDLEKRSFDRAVKAFGEAATNADVALFYFAGHAIEVRGTNYLLPVDASLNREADLEIDMLNVNLVLYQMEDAHTRLNVVILDACRNNPFGGRGTRAVGVGSGLASMETPDGTLIAFATSPGKVAFDVAGSNSPYTTALAATLRQPGLGLFDTFNQVANVVSRETGGTQVPWFSSSRITGSFYFSAPPAGGRAGDEIVWNVVKDTTDISALRRFIAEYPASARLDEARARIAALETAEARRKAEEALGKLAAAAPPVKPAAPPAASPCGAAMTVSWASRSARPLSAAEECVLKPKDTFKECDKCPEMVVVPTGSFTMGAPESAVERGSNEGPEHGVTFGRPFAVGKFHITVDQFGAFVTETGYDAGDICSTVEGGKREERSGRSWRNPGFPQKGSHPAVCFNWNDAQAYVEWVMRKTGKNYRLLTEAEWEYAARARTEPGTYARYSFGNDEKDLCRYGNGADQTTKSSIAAGVKDWTAAPCKDGYAYTSPIGSFAPNDFGLYDMQGNALQWTQDCYHGDYTGAPRDGSAWTSGNCDRRVVRGGGWNDNPQKLRAAYRGANAYSYRGYGIGLRIGRAVSR